jgi:hypothetical protein
LESRGCEPTIDDAAVRALCERDQPGNLDGCRGDHQA